MNTRILRFYNNNSIRGPIAFTWMKDFLQCSDPFNITAQPKIVGVIYIKHIEKNPMNSIKKTWQKLIMNKKKEKKKKKKK
jgi:hypothetical protein